MIQNNREEKYILWFEEICNKDVPLVGGKNASLGEMFSKLTQKGLNIPDGFAITAQAYFYFLKENHLTELIRDILKGVDATDIKGIQERGKKIRKLILTAKIPQDLKIEIVQKYNQLSEKYKQKNTDVAVRSSATAEDLPSASFAGQQETFLNIKGGDYLLQATKECFASLFTDRAIVYREEMKFDHLKIGLSVGVQKMVRSDKASAGVMFSCDTESGFGDVVLINASYGLGENVVKGRVEPDQYYVFETTLKIGFKPILEKRLGSKNVKLIYSSDPKNPTKNISTPQKERDEFVLNDEEIITLAKWSTIIEEHYERSMDSEWAKDAIDGKLYIVQARPETVQSQKNVSFLEEYILNKQKIGKILVEGLSVGNKIGQGKINRIMNVKEIKNFKKGDVLVTEMTDPDWVPAMKMASAIVTDSGGRTAHAAIVSRELGIPCVVGTGNASKVLKSGQEITVSCAEGETGKIYEGIIPFTIKKTNISGLEKPGVKIMMNIGDPSRAFNLSFIPNDGVGLAREEFIIANYIKIHPLALINYKDLSKELQEKINTLTLGYKDKTGFFVEKLSEGIGKIGAAFYPKPVIVRLSDFKTNEYKSLVGGELFEGEESNPMLGFRGAARFYDSKFSQAFILECKALKRAREEFGLTNIKIMVPFCRTVEEAKKVVELMEKSGLKKGDNGLEIYVMCEIPSNVILADEFLDIFDGMSIGSNDLTQLVLGLDRDSSLTAKVGDERNAAVKNMISTAIQSCKKRKKYIGICGEAPSTYPEFARFLMDEGIESMSLESDAIIRTMSELNKIKKTNEI